VENRHEDSQWIFAQDRWDCRLLFEPTCRRTSLRPGEFATHVVEVVRLLFDGSGKSIGEYEDFMTGFVVSDTQVWGRPVGIAVANDGSPFVTEDGNGTIWRVSYQGTKR
jgi:glucose/arabinose dehydrogenase